PDIIFLGDARSSRGRQRNELEKTGKAPQIFYCARTHTQLAQMVKEVKASPYRPTIATLGSR
ncbi:unnamed protein product, partial [Scytosiphon promiscuus]